MFNSRETQHKTRGYQIWAERWLTALTDRRLTPVSLHTPPQSVVRKVIITYTQFTVDRSFNSFPEKCFSLPIF